VPPVRGRSARPAAAPTRPAMPSGVRSPRIVSERVTRIELALSAWEADVLPLNYTREGRRLTRPALSCDADATCPTSYRMRQEVRDRLKPDRLLATEATDHPENGKLPRCCSLIAISRPRWNRAA
jgi:hypothetical protein